MKLALAVLALVAAAVVGAAAQDTRQGPAARSVGHAFRPEQRPATEARIYGRLRPAGYKVPRVRLEDGHRHGSLLVSEDTDGMIYGSGAPARR